MTDALRHPGLGGRLNLLLSEPDDPVASWATDMPRLLEPLGIRSLRACTGREAADYIRREPIHIAVVDLAIPLDDAGPVGASAEPGGMRVLQLLGRLETPPPTVVVRKRRSPREAARQLTDALHAGAFSVVDRPVNIETMLETMRRILRRFYADAWPTPPTG
jgi:CheY-like chemotaxis protein